MQFNSLSERWSWALSGFTMHFLSSDDKNMLVAPGLMEFHINADGLIRIENEF